MRTFPAFILACALAAAAPAALGQPSVSSGDPGAEWQDRGGAQRQQAQIFEGQTSDGVRGEIAGPLRPGQRNQVTRSIRKTWRVAPGVNAIVWDERDARGPIRAHLLTVDYQRAGLKIDYANAGAVRQTAPVSTILARSKAIAGVNGDFFDIGDTGAPLGLGRDRQRGLLNAREAGWNSAFYLAKGGRPDIGSLPMRARFKERPGLRITNVNSPEVQPDGIGVYTRSWGRTSGYRVTGGQKKQVRMVQVHKGRVVSNSTKLTSDAAIKGQMLVGRGPGAEQLAGLRSGDRATIRYRLAGAPQMAITGNKFLVTDGVIRVVDDREMHPRTAVGIDRDTKQILLLLVDGRQSFSRGYTMVELADMMIDLGADEALNLDGGGSSTMIAKKRNGNIGVVNSPSDGSQRSVPNAIEVTYKKPR